MPSPITPETPHDINVGGVLVRHLPGLYGDAPPERSVALLNGIGAGNEHWGKFACELQKTADVILVDVLGVIGDGKHTSMADYSTAVNRALQVLGHDRMDLFGVSWGGALAQETARRHPKRVGKLVLAATLHGLTSIPPTLAAFRGMNSGDRLSAEFKERARDIFGGDIRDNPELLEEIGILREVDPEAYKRQRRAILAWPHSLFRTALIRHETLVMGGADDPLSRLINARLIAGAIHRSRLHIVKKNEGGGHLFHLTRAPETARVMAGFLGHLSQK